jgi:hypothetical protein
MQALKAGDAAITELQSKAKLEDFEELYERQQDQMARIEMEQELFGGMVPDQDELLDELNALEAQEEAMDIPNANFASIHVDQKIG